VVRSEGDGAEQAFHSGLAKVEVDYKSGYIDQTGKVVIPTQFTYAYPFADGIAAATKSEDGESGWGFHRHLRQVGNPTAVLSGQTTFRAPCSSKPAPRLRLHRRIGSLRSTTSVSPGKIDCVENWGDFLKGSHAG